MKKLLSVMMAILLIAGIMIPMLSASALSTPNVVMSASATSVTKGSKVTITVRFSASDAKIGSIDYSLTYNATKMTYVPSESESDVSDSGGVITGSFYKATNTEDVVLKFVFTGKAVGSAVFSLEVQEIAATSKEFFPIPNCDPKTVTITDVQKSDNAFLKSVNITAYDVNNNYIGKGSLTPAFSKNVTTYTVKVPSNTKFVSIERTTEDTKATNVLAGPYGEPAGAWARTVTVTAENGTKKTYTFNIVKDGATTPTPDPDPTPEPEPTPNPEEELRVIVNGIEYTIVSDVTNISTPKGFELGIGEYNSVDIPVYVSNDKKTVLACLENEEGESKFFIYQKEFILFTECVWETFENSGYIFDDAFKYSSTVEKLTAKELEIGKTMVMAYKMTVSEEFYLVWATGEDGIGKLYVYDNNENTLQRYGSIHSGATLYVDTDSNKGQTALDPLAKVIDLKTAIFVGAGLIVIILVLFIAWLAALGKARRMPKTEAGELFVPFSEDTPEINAWVQSFSDSEENDTFAPMTGEEIIPDSVFSQDDYDEEFAPMPIEENIVENNDDKE